MKLFEDGEVLYAEDLNALSNTASDALLKVDTLYNDFNVQKYKIVTDKTEYAYNEEYVSMYYDAYMTGTGGISPYNGATEGSKLAILTCKIPDHTEKIQILNTSAVSGNGKLLIAFFDKDLKFIEGINSETSGDNITLIVEGEQIPEDAAFFKTNLRYRTWYDTLKYSIKFAYRVYYDEFGLDGKFISNATIPMSAMDENWHLVFDPLMKDAYMYKDITKTLLFNDGYMENGKIVSTNVNYSYVICPLMENIVTITITNFSVFSGNYALQYFSDDMTYIGCVRDVVSGYTVNGTKSYTDPIPTGASYVVIDLRSTQKGSIKVVYTLSGAKLLNTELFSGGSGGATGGATENAIHELTVANSDKIAFIGDSYTESSYCVRNKSYVDKISLFSDFQMVNFGLSGDIFLGRMYDIRRKVPKFGTIPFDELAPKYAVMTCYTNDIKYMNRQTFLQCAENILKFLRGIGTIPIVATEYHTSTGLSTTLLRTGLRKLANDYNLLFFDIASIVDLIRGQQDYAPFWGGSHPGTRSCALESDSFLAYLDKFERPEKSIKIYRPRYANSISYEDIDLDNYMFGNIYERAKQWKEIDVGCRCLVNEADVENCTSAPITTETSEYLLLMKGELIPMENMCLVSAILPYDNHNLKYVSLHFEAWDENNENQIRPLVYVMNHMAEPYPVPTKYSNFYVDPTLLGLINVNDTFICSDDNATYTVYDSFVDAFGQYHVFCLPYKRDGISTTGTLTGTGTTTLTMQYTFRETGYLSSAIEGDSIGHYTQDAVPDINGNYDISDVLHNVVKEDQVNFLLKYNGKFNIKDIKISYLGDIPKQIHQKAYKFYTNYYNTNAEILPVTKFTTLGVDSTYGCTVSKGYELLQGKNTIPVGCTYLVNISQTNKITYTLPKQTLVAGKKYMLELWIRFFPKFYDETDLNGCITQDSFDYNEIIIEFGDVLYKRYANTHWKIVQIPIYSYYANYAYTIKVYTQEKTIELAYISLKEADALAIAEY